MDQGEVQRDQSRLCRMTASSSNVLGLSARSQLCLGIFGLLVDRKIDHCEISRTWWPIPDKTSENWGIYRPSRGHLQAIYCDLAGRKWPW